MLRRCIRRIHKKYAITVNQAISVDQVPEAFMVIRQSPTKKLVFSVIFLHLSSLFIEVFQLSF